MDKIPNFLMSVDDELENVYETSYVANPATEHHVLYFNNEDTTINQTFKAMDGDYERMTSGVWMMPDTKYIRKTEDGELYTVEFSAESLENALKKHLKNNLSNLVKVEHSGSYLEGFVSMEHWIIRDENTTSPVFGLSLTDLGYTPADIPVGTVMKTTYVQDEDFWNEMIITGKVSAYSIGGLFNLQAFSKHIDLEQNKTKEDMTKIAELFLYLGVPQSFGTVLLNDENKTTLTFAADTITNGADVVVDGEFQLFNGMSIVIKEGKLVDFGFNEVAEVAEVVEVAEETIIGEVVEETIIEEVTEEVITETVESVITEEITAVDNSELMAANAQITALTEELGLLKAKMTQKEEENANLIKEVVKKPIKTTSSQDILKKVSAQNTNNTNNGAPQKTLTMGGRTINL